MRDYNSKLQIFYRNMPTTKDEKDNIKNEKDGDQRPILATSLEGKPWQFLRSNEDEANRNLMGNILSTQIKSVNGEGQMHHNRTHNAIKTLKLDKIVGRNTTNPMMSQVISSADPWFYLHGFKEYRLKEYRIV